MKKIFLIIFLLLVGTIGISGTSQAYSNVSFSIGFHDALSPYGTWFNYSNYGNCWRPNVYAGWSPYTQGHWVYTSYGPMFDSPEPYAWATYHYGQWVYSASYGWIWVPGYDYYPSRVSWAYGNDYLAWSPIYPAPSYANVNLWFGIDRGHWGYNDYRNVILRGDRVRPLFERREVQIRNARLDRRDFERFTGRPVRVTPVREQFVQADNRRVKLVVPQHREATVVKELNRAQERRVAANRDKNDRNQIRDNRENRNNQIVEKRDSKGNQVFENKNSKNNREVEVRNKSNDRHGNREVTTNYSSKKLITKPSSKSKSSSSSHKSNVRPSTSHRSNDQQIPKNMASKQSSKKSHEAPVKYSSRSNSSRSKAPMNYSNRYSSKSHEASKSYSHKSSPREVNSKYSSNNHRPDMKQSSKQVNQVSRKEVHSSKAQNSSSKQNRKPPKKH